MNYSQIMSPVPLCLEKWGVITHPAPMGAPPLGLDDNNTNNTYNTLFNLVFVGDNLDSLDVSSEECF